MYYFVLLCYLLASRLVQPQLGFESFHSISAPSFPAPQHPVACRLFVNFGPLTQDPGPSFGPNAHFVGLVFDNID